MNKRINIAYTINNDYLPYCLSSIISVIKNSKSNNLRFYIITNYISKFNRIRLFLNSLFFNFKYNLTFISEETFKNCYLPANGHFSKANYFRLRLPSILLNIDKVIYLDSDTIVLSDIQELWDQKFFKEYLIIASESVKNNLVDNHKRLKLKNNEPYFNSGILVLNLKELRKQKFENKFFDFIRATKIQLNNVDQDVINIVLKNKIQTLSPHWNAQVRFDYDQSESELSIIRQAKILHFLTSNKPWKNKNHPYKNLYYSYYPKLFFNEK